MDRVGADFFHSVETIVSRLKCRPVPIQIPIGAEDQFKGVIDLIAMKARIWRDETLGAAFEDLEIPAELREQAEEYREKMIEAVSEADERLFDKYVARRGADAKTSCRRASAGRRSRRRSSR